MAHRASMWRVMRSVDSRTRRPRTHSPDQAERRWRGCRKRAASRVGAKKVRPRL